MVLDAIDTVSIHAPVLGRSYVVGLLGFVDTELRCFGKLAVGDAAMAVQA